MATSKSLHFFATKHDLESLIASVESQVELRFVQAGMFDSPEARSLTSGLNIPNLGLAPSGDHNLEPWWLVLDRETEIVIDGVPQRRVGTRYAIDQRLNPNSVAFSGGGVYQDSCVIDGNVGTCTNNQRSHELVNLFSREIRRQFKRIKSFYVGPEAEQLLDAGYRLTIGVNTSTEIDLSRN